MRQSGQYLQPRLCADSVSTSQDDEDHNTYNDPERKISITASLWLMGMWSLTMMGNGSPSIAISLIRFVNAATSYIMLI